MKKSAASKMSSAPILHLPAYLKRIVHRSDRRRGKQEINKVMGDEERATDGARRKK